MTLTKKLCRYGSMCCFSVCMLMCVNCDVVCIVYELYVFKKSRYI